MKKPNAIDHDVLFLKLFFKSGKTEVTDQEVEYFRQHPDQIDEITAPVKVHKFFLWAGALLGTICVAISKLLDYSKIFDYLHEGVQEFLIDIVFEIGVALIGAAVTAYLLGILLNQQQQNATIWRAEVRRRIAQVEESEKPG